MRWLDLAAWKRFERKVMQRVQAVVVFTERDRESIRKHDIDIPVVQIPLGTEIPESAAVPTEEPFSLIFVGNFKHLPNLDAADRLMNRIFPQVQDQVPESRLYVVGEHLPTNLLKRVNEKIVATGYVRDVKPYLDRASIVVVPIRLGGGMRVKVLEALAAGKAIVASARAVEGLDLKNGEQMIQAEDDDEFGHAIIHLLKNPRKRNMLAANAQVWASENLSWEKTALAYDDLYHQLIRAGVSTRHPDPQE